MKKRILCFLLLVVMILGMLPSGVLAADTEESNYELKILSFEDEDESSYWAGLIDSQYGGSLLYGPSGSGFENKADAYSWTDPVTGLTHTICSAYGSYCYWSGGHAISHYASGDVAEYGGYESQLTVYSSDISGLATSGGGHGGSNNFAVHYGYIDSSPFNMAEELPAIAFADGSEHVIDSMYVNNMCYALNCYYTGNSLTPKIGESDWVKIVATGYDASGSKTNTAEFYLCNGPENIVSDWTKWDLSSLGKVAKVEFNITGSSDNGAGFSQPAYFAYDDVAVRFENEEPVIAVTGILGDPSEITLTEGDTEQLSVTVLPEDASDKSVTWSSTNEAVATVDENGIVTAVSVGEAVIKATTVDGGFTAECAVTVEYINLKSIQAYDFNIQYISEQEGTVTEIGTNNMMANAGGVSVVSLPADAVIIKVDASDNYAQKLIRTKNTASQAVNTENAADTDNYFNDSEFANHANMTSAIEKITLNAGAKIPAFGVTGFMLDGREFYPSQHDDFVFVQIEKEWTAPEEYNTITVKAAPSSANVTFYSGESADTEWNYVKDNGVNGKYHEYVVYAPAGTYSYRAADSDTDLGGMSFTVGDEKEQNVTLVRTNYYTTNANITSIGDYNIEIMPGSMKNVVTGTQYVDSSNRVVTPTLLWANGNAMLYNWKITLNGTIANTYGVAMSINNTFANTLSATQNKTFTLANLVDYAIVAPSGAEVKMFNQLKNFNVEEVGQESQETVENGNIKHIFRTVESSNLTYRVSLPGKITRAGYMGSAEKKEPVIITFGDSENPKATENIMDNTTMQSRIESSTFVNVNRQNDLHIDVNGTYRLRAYRGAWEIINSDTANIMIEPDFHYNVISGAEHITLTPATNRCTGNAKDNWMDIKGISAGTAIIEVSYDAIIIGGSGTTYTGQYGATDPSRKSLVVIQVGENAGTLNMKAKGHDSAWDTELDTVYTVEDIAAFSFTATLDGEEPTVMLSTDKGNTWTSVAKEGDYFTASGLVSGNNILKFTANGNTAYQVVRAAKVKYSIENKSRNTDTIMQGDKITVTFEGAYMAIPKMSGIYNPQSHTLVYGETTSASKQCGGYDLPSKCAITLTIGDTVGEQVFENGNIRSTMFCANDPMGAHRTLTDAGVGANFSAVSLTFNCGVYPTLKFDVAEKTACEHEWSDIGEVIVAHTLTKAGEMRYKCEKCGEYKYVATKKGKCENFAVEVAAQAPTATKDGHKAGTWCSECHKVLSGMEPIIAITINKVDITVTEPEDGATPQCPFETATDENYNYSSSWEDLTTNTAFDKFQAGHLYRFTVSANTNDISYIFPSTVSATVNGASAVIDDSTDSSLIFHCDYVVAEELTAPTPTITTTASSGKPTLKWTAVAGATSYEIWRATSKTGTYSKTYTTSKTSYTNTGATAGYTYYYKVRAVDASGNVSAYSAVKYITCDCARPVATIANVASSGKPKLSWDAVTGANKYYVYRSTDKGATYSYLGSTTNTSYTNTGAAAGNTYYYKVKAVCGKSSYGNSAESTAKYITCDCARPTVSISLSSTSGKPKLSWSAITGAGKYYVYRSTDGGKTYSYLGSTTKTSYTNTGATAGKTYYYRVKAVCEKTSYGNSAQSTAKYIKSK